MKLHLLPSKSLITLMCLLLTSLHMPLSFAKPAPGKLVLKVISNTQNDAQMTSLTLSSADIECIEQASRVIRANGDDVTYFGDRLPDKLNKGDKVLKNDTVILGITDSASNELSQLTRNNIGQSMQIIYKNKVLITAMIAAPLAKNISITSAPAGLFTQLKQEMNLRGCPVKNSVN